MSQDETYIETNGNLEPFDNLLPELPAQLDSESRRITATRPSGIYVVADEPTNKYHKLIFDALARAFQTPWFTGLTPGSQNRFFAFTRQLFNWINESGYLTTEDNRYECLKDFEAHRLNVDGLKHSPLKYIHSAMKKGLNTESLSNDEYRYLRTLLRVTKLPKTPETQPYTLTDWFALPWLRSIIGEQQYLSLESPSRLFNSFRVTVATTLSYLLEIRTQWKQRHSQACESMGHKGWYLLWNSQMMKHLGAFNASGEPTDGLTEALCLDMVSDRTWPTLKALIAERGVESAGTVPLFQKRFVPWKVPVIFHPNNISTYSNVEETLMSWLVACETVQPSDIPKLKTTDYAYEYNSSGRLIAMQCSYYKGRAGAIREPAMLIASDCWTKAQHSYLTGLPTIAHLFQLKVKRQSVLPDFGADYRSVNFPLSMIFKLWQTPRLQARIRAACARAGALSIFLEATLALSQGSQSYRSFLARNQGASRSDYETTLPRPLPSKMFSLSHIKTTAVHAGSDRYRDGDLINHHSHTSATEKHHYLTDANKDFVNRAGRITRVVLHDLQNVVYQPSVSAIEQTVNDLDLRSRVIEATGSTDAQVHPLNLLPAPHYDAEGLILVPDTVEQALIFIHSIAQAEERYQQLLKLRPDWVERTLLPHLEWMSRTLINMRTATEAQKQYEDLKPCLPPLFDHLLETHE